MWYASMIMLQLKCVNLKGFLQTPKTHCFNNIQLRAVKLMESLEEAREVLVSSSWMFSVRTLLLIFRHTHWILQDQKTKTFVTYGVTMGTKIYEGFFCHACGTKSEAVTIQPGRGINHEERWIVSIIYVSSYCLTSFIIIPLIYSVPSAFGEVLSFFMFVFFSQLWATFGLHAKGFKY